MPFRTAAAIITLSLALTGCTTSSYDLEPGNEDHLESRDDDYQQSEEYLQAEADAYLDQQAADFAPSGWRCYWDPTMNDDWHDDYQCTNGVDYDRPYLIPDDSFVEGWEIDAAAAEYEASLNGN
ncbi:hypothetical protein [Agromyces bauzanensis]|uniref:Lipoprotein n=1 Tax=Agromyces bauzanensis TaxID=1308924 RepID=A0A917PGE8_9MICO|nr:hypothetical protein [Agromyces bauzanensis]GGJ76405.1 hypothetical protein GCM10011372_13270 [Agromyces bauzanensis]